MALSIGVTAGSRINVAGHIVEVKAIARPNLIVLTVDEGPEMVVSDQARTEILPKVFVFSGLGQSGGTNRLAFEADKVVPIHRIE